MGKLYLIVMILFVTATATAQEEAVTTFSVANKGPEEAEKLLQELETFQEKVTKLHFYLHEIRGNTSISVASANITSNSPTNFGSVVIIDDPLTIGPEFSSKPVGRAQGLCASTSFSELRVNCDMSFIFTEGIYNGSTLIILGSIPLLHKVRELPVVGGTGIFRLARGVAVLKVFFFAVSGANFTIEYNVMVQHY